MSDHRPGTARRRLAAAAFAAALAACLALASPPSAAAGTYRAVQCHAGLGAGHQDSAFTRTSDRYRGAADCEGRGLSVTHSDDGWRTRGGRSGSWTLHAPAGTEIVRAAARVAGDGQDWHAPQLFVSVAGGARRFVAGVRGSLHPVVWSGRAGRALTARLACVHAERCGPGERALMRLRGISLLLRDAVAPTLRLDGPLLEAGSRRGVQRLDVAAGDVGSGVRSLVLLVNGEPLALRTLRCELADGVATRLRPCPAAPASPFEVATAAQGFRQGPNTLRVCAADLSLRTEANRTCLSRTVRVDNRCPLSGVRGSALRARFRGAGSRLRARGDRRARVVGRVLGADGAPVAGAEVCVAARLRVPGTPERVVATPETGADGRFQAVVPPGASREIRVAHWPDSDRALERYLRLTSRAVPALRLRPRRTMRNGDRLRFAVRLPGPMPARRRVAVEARADGRWIRIAGGRSGPRGRWRGAYRFRSTTGRRTYAFRAVVPKQRGYPYEAGRSATKTKTVVGR